jgi:uncharacterized protein (TIGR03083 family)
MQKHELIERARQEFAEVMNAIAGLDDDALTLPGIHGWSIRAVIAHLTGWAHFDTEILRRLVRGERPLPEGEAFDVDDRNADYAREAASKAPATVVADFRAAFDEFMNAAIAVPEERFTEGRTAYRMMQGPAYEHLKEHRVEFLAYRSVLERG